MPENLTPAFQTALETGGGMLATFIRIRRRLEGAWDDDTALGFSDYIFQKDWGGLTYYPEDGIDLTSISRSSDTSIGNSGMNGILKTSRITQEEIEGKVYMGADITAFNLFLNDDAWGAEILGRGILGNFKLTGDGITFQTEYRDMIQLCQVDVQRKVQAPCPYVYGDPSTCKISLAGKEFVQSVIDVSPDGLSITFDGPTKPDTPPYFAFSPLKSLGGPNFKLRAYVNAHVNDLSGRPILSLQEPFPFTVNIGDSFKLQKGCDHTWDGPTGCKAQGNAVNFGGFPHLAGNRMLNLSGINTPQPKRKLF